MSRLSDLMISSPESQAQFLLSTSTGCHMDCQEELFKVERLHKSHLFMHLRFKNWARVNQFQLEHFQMSNKGKKEKAQNLHTFFIHIASQRAELYNECDLGKLSVLQQCYVNKKWAKLS